MTIGSLWIWGELVGDAFGSFVISFHNSALGNVLLLKAIELVSFSFVFILRSLSFFSFSYSSHSHSFIICFFFPLFSLHFFPISSSFCSCHSIHACFQTSDFSSSFQVYFESIAICLSCRNLSWQIKNHSL